MASVVLHVMLTIGGTWYIFSIFFSLQLSVVPGKTQKDNGTVIQEILKN